MLLLKSTRQCPPNGFIFRQPQTGWELQSWDFEQLCQELQKHRQANPKYGLTTNMDAIRLEVNQTNALRVMQIPTAESYVTQEGGQPLESPKALLRSRLEGVAVVGKKLAAGKRLLVEWLGSGGEVVDQEKANSRAAICVKCPKNNSKSLTQLFTVPVSNAIKSEMERKKQMNLETPFDNELGVCEACLCPMRLKVWSRTDLIQKHLINESKQDLDPGCWIPTET